MTNALPVHRLALSVGSAATALAVYVRSGLSVERPEQDYARISDDGPRQRYRYEAKAFGFKSSLIFDESGLLLDYPGIATRAG